MTQSDCILFFKKAASHQPSNLNIQTTSFKIGYDMSFFGWKIEGLSLKLKNIEPAVIDKSVIDMHTLANQLVQFLKSEI